MDKIKLEKFKAFESEISINLEGKKNFLLYGENGAGKSSLYQSIKVVFFRSKIESTISARTPEDEKQKKDELWSSYNNKIHNLPFAIEINDTKYDVFDISNYQVFMISLEELAIDNKVDLKSLLERFCFSIPDVASLCKAHCKDIQKDVNAALTKFQESVTIDIDEEDDYTIKIVDPKRSIESKQDIKKYFNEAKLNLIVLLILLNAVKKSKDVDKSKILVLDDFITSLDVSNRTFLIKYIFDDFIDMQVLIFTHNISFYNLVMFMVNEVYKQNEKWVLANLFEINNVHKVYIKSEIETAEKIKKDYYDFAQPHQVADIEGVGNRIRKKFEVLLYEYSKLLMIGAVEDSNKILDRIIRDKSAYYKDGKTASDLLDEIQAVLNENNFNNIIQRLQRKIDNYRNTEFDNFKIILKELILYRKVTMHSMSHGINGMPTFTTREIEQSILLLEKMEEFISRLVDKNVVTA